MKRTTSLVFIPGRAASIDRLERSVARQLVHEGHARWKNRCDDIEMLRINYPLRGLSCQGMMQWGLGAQAYTVGELRLQNGQRRNHLGKVIPYISAEVRVMA